MTDIAAGQGKSGGGGRSAPAGKADARKTAAGSVAVAERETAKEAGGFYDGAMYLVQISDWPADKFDPGATGAVIGCGAAARGRGRPARQHRSRRPPRRRAVCHDERSRS